MPAKEYPVITIDGPACAGKGTMADYLAGQLPGFAHLDTGTIYRAIAYAADRAGFKSDDIGKCPEAVRDAVLSAQVSTVFVPSKHDAAKPRQLVCLDLKELSENDLRTPRISQLSSELSVHPMIRRIANDVIRAAAGRRALIIDGRDTGTAVFPDADLKFYLWAPLEERAKRRQAQELNAGKGRAFLDVINDLNERDQRDSSREHDPLRFPPDAIWIDTGAFLEEGVKRFLRDVALARLNPTAVKII